MNAAENTYLYLFIYIKIFFFCNKIQNCTTGTSSYCSTISMKTWYNDISEWLSMWQKGCMEVLDLICRKHFSNVLYHMLCGMLCLSSAGPGNDASGDIMSSCQSTGKWDTDRCTTAIQNTTVFQCLPFSLPQHCLHKDSNCGILSGLTNKTTQQKVVDH